MRTAIWLVTALAMATPRLALAADPPAGEATTATGDRGKQAQTAADDAYKAYEAGDYTRAIALYLESYKVAATADALFNIASIYDKKLQDPKLAIEFYRRYDASPDATSDLVARATARIAALSAPQESAPATSAPAKSEAPSSADPDPGRTLRLAGLVTGAAGVVGLAVGTGFALSAKSKHSDATAAGCGGGTCPDANSAGMERDAAKSATIATIGFVAGGALIAGGVTMLLLAPARKDSGASTALRVTPAVGPGSAGLALTGSFF